MGIISNVPNQLPSPYSGLNHKKNSASAFNTPQPSMHRHHFSNLSELRNARDNNAFEKIPEFYEEPRLKAGGAGDDKPITERPLEKLPPPPSLATIGYKRDLDSIREMKDETSIGIRN